MSRPTTVRERESLDGIVGQWRVPTVEMPVVEQMKALSRCFFRREFQVDVDRVNTDVFDSSDSCATILNAVYHQVDLVVIGDATQNTRRCIDTCVIRPTCPARRSFVVSSTR